MYQHTHNWVCKGCAKEFDLEARFQDGFIVIAGYALAIVITWHLIVHVYHYIQSFFV